MIREADGILPEGLKFTAVRLGRPTRIYEVITPGIYDGSELNGEPVIKVLVGRLDEFDQVEKNRVHLVPQDLLHEAFLSKKHIFRGYRVIPLDKNHETNSVAIQAIIDRTSTIIAETRRRLIGI